jgi:hypothetical protein
MLYGNLIYSVGSILVAGAAQTRSYKFMIAGRVVRALGDIATQIAQYKVFSSWFAPGNGFGSTLGFELGVGKMGAFAGKSSANIIAKRTGNFAWVFWVAVFMNIFTNVMTVVFYWFTKVANRKFHGINDPATGEKLSEKSKKFEIRKVLKLPWSFWAVMAFSLFETSTAIVFLQNATELAEQRFGTDSIAAGWYSSVLQYAGKKRKWSHQITSDANLSGQASSLFLCWVFSLTFTDTEFQSVSTKSTPLQEQFHANQMPQWFSAASESSRPCSSSTFLAPSKEQRHPSVSLPLRIALDLLLSSTALVHLCGIAQYLARPTRSRSH